MNFDHDTGRIDSLLTIDTTITPPSGGTTNSLVIQGTGALFVPIGDTASRPANAMGQIRFNTTTARTEFNNGTTWDALSSVTTLTVTGSTGLTVGGSPLTSSGTITLTLDSGLQSLASLATTGIIVQSVADTFITRTITGTALNISVTNGDGVSGNPTIDLIDAGTPVSASFVKITTDAKGRVTATTSVIAGDITTLVDATYVNVSGDTMSSAANLTFSGGGEVLGLPNTPTTAGSATSKFYVDALIQGLDPKQSVRVATTVAGTLATSFANGQIIDDITLVTGDRILIKNQAAPAENGIYTVNATGAPTRALDMDVWTEVPGAYTFVELGTVNADVGYVCTSDQGGTLGTTAITFVVFTSTGSGAVTSVTGTANQITASPTTGAVSLSIPSTFIAPGSIASTSTITAGTTLTVSGLTANSFIYSGTAGLITSAGAPTDGQLLIGSTGVAPVRAALTAGTGVSISNGAGSITINNTGVTSVALAAPAAVFAVTGSPVTTTGTLTLTFQTQANNSFFAGPTTGGPLAPTFRSIAFIDLATAIQLYRENPSTPTTPLVAGTNAVAVGSGSSASGTRTLALGAGALASQLGAQAFGNLAFATQGDAQQGTYILKNITTNATPTALFLDGTAATVRLVVPVNSVWTFFVQVTGRRTDATGGSASYKFEGNIRKDATNGTTTFTGTPAKTILGETNAAWDANVTANTTDGDLRITVTGEAAKTIRWVATVMTTEVTN
jgi:Head domain of trimeric autotransporter adhesin